MVFIQQSRQYGTNCRRRLLMVAHELFGVDAEPDRLSQQRVCVLLAGQLQHGPGSPGQHDAMDVDVIVDCQLQLIEGIDRRPGRYCSEARFGFV